MENSFRTGGQKTGTAGNCMVLLGLLPKPLDVVGVVGMPLAGPREPVEARRGARRRRVHASIYVRAREAPAGRGGPVCAPGSRRPKGGLARVEPLMPFCPPTPKILSPGPAFSLATALARAHIEGTANGGRLKGLPKMSTETTSNRDRIVSADDDGKSIVTFSFISGKDEKGEPIFDGSAVANLVELPAEIQTQCALYGLRAKLATAVTTGAIEKVAESGEPKHVAARRSWQALYDQLCEGTWNAGREATGGREVSVLVDAMCYARVKAGKPEMRDVIREAVLAAKPSERHEMLMRPAVMAAAAELAAQRTQKPTGLDGLLDD